MHTDPIADMLNRLRNGLHARHDEVRIPYSKHKEAIARLIAKQGYAGAVNVEGEGKEKNIMIELLPERRRLTIVRRSKPGQRVYVDHEVIRKNTQGHGLAILSTSRGLLSAPEAIKAKVGGEIICEIY